MKKIFILFLFIFLININYSFSQRTDRLNLDNLNLSNIDTAQLVKVNDSSVKMLISQPDKNIIITKENINNEIDRLKEKRQNLNGKVNEINLRIDALNSLKIKVGTILP